MKNRANRFLLAAFLLSLAAYIIIFAACFVDLPIGIPPWHQFLLLYAHSIPMFCLQLLLCRLARPWWRLMIPAGLLLIPGLVFLHFAQWYALGWLLFLWWCAAPVTGWALAWAVYTLQKKRRA